MYQSILLPVDTTGGAAAAMERALSLAETDDSTVHVLHVVESPPAPGELDANRRDELLRATEKRGREATANVLERADDRGIDVVREVIGGVPYRAILDYADETGVDLIVMGTHGRRGAENIRLGSTTERVVMLADVPVMSVRSASDRSPTADASLSFDNVVIPTDGSDVADRAAEHALSLAERSGATVHAVYVVDSTIYDLEDAPRSIVGMLREGGRNAVDAVAADARKRGLSVTTNVLRGTPDEAILEYANGVDANLVAMGTRGRAAGTERVIGSTTARILRRFDRPLLTVG